MPGPNLNKVFLIGRLTRDPEMRYTSSGQAVVTLRLAVNRDYQTKDGNKREDTCFVNLVVWGKRAEVCAEYMRKGSLIFVEGRLNSRSWETPEKEKRSTLEVQVDNFQFLDRASADVSKEMSNGSKVNREGLTEETTEPTEEEKGEGM
jgi:single-strand DNA-binding protein